MILSQPELRAAVAAGEIKFDPPLEERQWGAASIDRRLKVELTPLLDRPCQLTFFELTSALPERLAYGNKQGDAFAEQSHPLHRRSGEMVAPA